MNVLHLTCSPRGPGSESQRLSQAIVDRLLERHPGASVVQRDLGLAGPAHVDSDYAHALGTMQTPLEAALQDGSLGVSERLVVELEAADYVVLGTPMHNYTVPSTLKAWIDHVLRVNRTFGASPEGKKGYLRDRPVLVAVASGGVYSGEDARQPDFLTPYLKAVFATIGLRDVTFFSAQGLAYGAEAARAAMARAQAAIGEHFLVTPRALVAAH